MWLCGSGNGSGNRFVGGHVGVYESVSGSMCRIGNKYK
jgi:hypothetical protein